MIEMQATRPIAIKIHIARLIVMSVMNSIMIITSCPWIA